MNWQKLSNQPEPSLHTKKLGSVMNREDMDLVADKPIDNSVGAVNHFANSGIVDLRDYTTGLREGRQAFSGSYQLLGYE